MALRFCVVPKVAGALTGSLVAKYLHGVVDYDALDYGRDAFCLAAADLTGAQASNLQAQSDAVVFPLDIDALLMAGQVTTFQTELENRRIPGQWVTTSHNSRDVIRIVAKLTQLLIYFQAQYAKSFWELGITLATTMGDLTAGQRQALQDAAAHFGVSSSGVTLSSTVREVLKLFADRMPALRLAGQTF